MASKYVATSRARHVTFPRVFPIRAMGRSILSLHYILLVKLKPIIEAQISGKWVTSGISDIEFASVYSEKTRLKKMIMIIIMNLSQETTVFGGRRKLSSAMKLRPEK